MGNILVTMSDIHNELGRRIATIKRDLLTIRRTIKGFAIEAVNTSRFLNQSCAGLVEM